MVTFTFDDGWKSHYTEVLPILRYFNVPGTFYVVSAALQEPHFRFSLRPSEGFMSLEEVEELASHGHEIGAHTERHPYLPRLTPHEQLNEILAGKDDLDELGFAPETFAYPYGGVTPAAMAAAERAGFIGARSVIKGLNDRATDPFLLRTVPVEEHTSLAELRAWIGQAARTNCWLIFMFHEVAPAPRLKRMGFRYGTTPAMLETALSLVYQAELPVVTVADGLVRAGVTRATQPLSRV
jgi:peptidoglycan/xylan/chitin deacetylase (PgdA/CDA1 family)